MRYVTCAALALLLASSKPTIGAETRSAQQYIVTVLLDEIPLARSKQEAATRANPQVMVLANEEAIVDVRGERKLGEKKIPFGMLFKVNVSQIDSKKVRATGMLEKSSVGALDEGVISRESFSVHFDKTVELGNKARVCVSKSSERELWFELLVDEPKNLQVRSAGAGPVATAAPVARDSASIRRKPNIAK